MPELPEIETLRRDLSDLLLARTIKSVTVRHQRSVRAHAFSDEFSEPLAGCVVYEVFRKGKFLSIAVGHGASPDLALVAHMGMSGQIRSFSMYDSLPKHAHIWFELSGDSLMVFVDPRTFGQMYLDELGSSGMAASLGRLGVDPLNEPGLVRQAVKRFSSSSVGIKWLLLDQTIVCGIGNMYADEILFHAGIRFDRPGSSLSESELDVLSKTIPAVLSEAVALRGSSLKDLQYRDVHGAIGGYQKMHLAYGREGRDCLRCGQKIERVFAKGRSSYLCRSCQR